MGFALKAEIFKGIKHKWCMVYGVTKLILQHVVRVWIRLLNRKIQGSWNLIDVYFLE